MEASHIPVLLNEALEFLEPESGGIYVDGTLGMGGHTSEILKRSYPDGRVIGIDRDTEALKIASVRLQEFGDRVSLMHGNFSEMGRIAHELGIKEVDGILLDVGVSSLQIDTDIRGFSFLRDAPLDMRMDTTCGITAGDIVNNYSPKELQELLWKFGEESYARRIVREIIKAREISRIATTRELARIVERSIPRRDWPREIHPATKTFQALRIAVNDELGSLERGLDAGMTILKSGGRFCVVSFHSLEDRIVKNRFRDWEKPCICPPSLPVCNCGKVKTARVLTKKAVKASDDEITANPRARSARLRVAEKI
ncbi:MAG: 16S rRNA (cytosine(1402)-N(4))-methyltransferase RsmH [Deltaproteobacteria bacterium]